MPPPTSTNTSPSLIKLNLLLLTSYLGAISNGYISALISSLIANPTWYTSFPSLSNPTLLGLVVAAQPLGCILAFFPAPWVSDTYGRRASILFGNLLMSTGFLAQVFCKTAFQFFGMRLLVGFGSIFNTIASAALVLELAHPKQRSIAGALFNTFYFVGSMAAAWVSYGTLKVASSWSWRGPVAISLVWTLSQFVLLSMCPESPRWLVAHGRLEDARAIMVEYYANGRVDDTLVREELANMSAVVQMERQTRDVNWSALYRTPGNRKRLVLSITIGVATQWVGNGIITYYLAPVLRSIGITSVFKQQGLNGGLQIYNWVLAFGAALLTERLGRRRLFLISTGTMLVFMIMVTICSAFYSTTKSPATGYAVIVFLFLFFGGYVIGLTPIPILYVNEIWPDHLRVKGTSVFWVVQAVATCFNQYVNPIALRSIMWRYYLVYVGVLVGVTVFVFYYVPETKGLSLEEVSRIFDRDGEDDVELREFRSRRNVVEGDTVREADSLN
ncbi:general substrate transporter [Paraphoma chrysanthemicola]|nr:general substrate transporter [Paraphoma chrysanthemicola]